MAAKQASARGQIAEYLRRLLEEGGSDNFVAFGVGPCRYVQFLTSCGSAVIYGEASSGRYCRPGCTCAPTIVERGRLLGLGWRLPTRRKFLNFHRYWSTITERDRDAIAESAVATLEILGWRGEPLRVELHLDW